MLFEKFWNASTGRLNRVNAAIDASNFYFNMLEIFQMYFTFPSFKNIATQRSFNEIIHFPLHCLKSTFSFQKSCRKSEKMIFARSFQLSSKSIFSLQKSCSKSEKIFLGEFFKFHQIFQSPFFPFRNPTESPKKRFWGNFSIFSKTLQKSCKKSEKWFLGDFFNFHQNFPKSIFPFRNPAESPKKWFLGDFFNFQKIFQSRFFPSRNPTENVKRWFSSKFLQHWTFTGFLW